MWIDGVIKQKIQWNEKLFSLQIAAEIAPFIPGQFIKLSQEINDKKIARAYSLVNSPEADYLEILAITVEDGKLSPILHNLQINDTIQVSAKAAGFMTLNEIPQNIGKHLWLLATGTAVGPFISMLQSAEIWQRFEKVILVYCVRFESDLAYKEQLINLQQKYAPQLSIIFSVTREKIPSALNCRIPSAIIDGSLENIVKTQINPNDSQVMICGNPQMVSDAEQALKDKGLTKNLRREPGNITVEKYW